MLCMYIAVENPNEKATHIKVSVRHQDKRVVLTVDPIVVDGNIISQAFNLASRRRSRFPLCDMPRLAPKQFKLRCEGVREVILGRKTDDHVWSMIREAADEAGVTVPETGVLNVKDF